LSQHTGTITRLAFTADGTRLASVSFDRSMMIWDIAAGQSLASISDLELPIRHMAFNADGSRMIIAGRSDVAYIIGLTDIGSRPISLTGPNTTPIRLRGGEVLTVAMNAAGDLVAIALNDITLRIYRVSSDGMEPVHTLRGVSGAFTAISFSPDGARIIAGSKAGVVNVWNVADGSHLAQFDELKTEIVAVGYAPSEKKGDSAADSAAVVELTERIIALDLDGMGMSWPLLSNDVRDREPFRGGRTPIADATLSDDHRWLVVASGNEIKVWDAHAVPPMQVGSAMVRDDAVFAVAVNAAGDRIAIGQAGGDVIVMPVKP
jgi:WD40 repeat protein